MRAVLALLFATTFPALAQPGSAQCQRDLEESSRLIKAIQARDRNPGVARGDTPGMCRVIRQNEADMAQVRRLRDPCLTGFNRRETLAQIDANLIDIREVLARHCR